MKLEIGKTYTILKADNTTVTFKFAGGEPPCGIREEQRIPLYEIVGGGYLAYWEADND